MCSISQNHLCSAPKTRKHDTGDHHGRAHVSLICVLDSGVRGCKETWWVVQPEWTEADHCPSPILLCPQWPHRCGQHVTPRRHPVVSLCSINTPRRRRRRRRAATVTHIAQRSPRPAPTASAEKPLNHRLASAPSSGDAQLRSSAPRRLVSHEAVGIPDQSLLTALDADLIKLVNIRAH